MANINYLLHESAVGYAVFEVVHQADTIGLRLQEVQDAADELSRFGKMVQVVNFAPYRGHTEALENINDVSEGILSDYLRSTLELSLPKTSGKKASVVLGVSDKKLAGEISTAFPGVICETADTSEVAADLLRGVRRHAEKLLKGLQDGDVRRAQLGLGHAYSRAKVKFSVHKNDNHIIQAIATLDNLDKGVNSACMRVREWYGWHFPELIKIVSDNATYAKLVLKIGNKSSLTDDKLDDLAQELGEDGEKAQAIIDAGKVSMGQDISETDLVIVTDFATQAVKMANYRRKLANALEKKMQGVAPNLQTILGTSVAARLIQHAGSLTNLAKYPASTLQILGAEKALFRALKTKGNTPKYGLIYQSTFIGRAGAKNKGRISRYLANKCSMASRIDNFSEEPNSKFGEALRTQLEDRLEFYATGKKPMKNLDAMQGAMDKILKDMPDADVTMTDTPGLENSTEAQVSQKKKEKRDKKEKKEKKRKSEVDESGVNGEKKKKKRKSEA